MVYHPDEPDHGAPYNIPLISQHPHHIPIYESLRHHNSAPTPTSSTATAPLSLHQQVVQPPTDAECGLPDLYTTTLSAIPNHHLPLSKFLSLTPKAVVLNDYTRFDIATSLAHALNLRRCNAAARAVLVVANSETAVREWVSVLCSVLDDVQLISYSRKKTKRDATLVRLRHTQFPGVVVAAEKAARDGFSEMWQALRENRLLNKWDIVVSEALSDSNVESVCSPLRMVRDCTAESGLVLARKGLSRAKATAVITGIDSVDMHAFWLKKKDLPALVEQCEKREDDERTVRSGRQVPDGKENRASRRNRDIIDGSERNTKPQHASHGPVIAKRRTSSGVVKPTKGKEPSPRAKPTRIPRAVMSRARGTSEDFDKLASGTDSSTNLRRSSKIPVKTALGDRSKSDEAQAERKGRMTAGPIKRRKAWNRISPEILSQLPGPRRRSPRFSPPLSPDESFPAPRSKTQPRQLRSTQSDLVKGPVVVQSMNGTKRANSRSRGSSSSVVLSRTEIIREDEDNTTSSRRNREKVQKRARALGIYDTESSEETFYTPPSHPMPPPSNTPSPDKFHTPRTSFSPEVVTDSSKPRRNALLKIVSQNDSSSRLRERKPTKSSSTRHVLQRTNSAPLKVDGSKRRNMKLNFGYSDSSDDVPLSARFADIRKAEDRGRAKIFLSPVHSAKKTAVQTTSEASKRKQTVKRPSVFDGHVSPNFTSSQKSNRSRRRHSFSGPVRVKHEADLVSRERPTGIPRYSATEARNRRKSVPNTMTRKEDLSNRDAHLPEGTPRYSKASKQVRRSSPPSTGSMLPLKRPSLEKPTTRSVPRNGPHDTLNASRARRASLEQLRMRLGSLNKAQNIGHASRASRSRSKVRQPSRSPVRNPSLVARPVQPDVIIINSDSEEDTVHDVTATKKRRFIPNGDSRQGTPRNHTEAGTSGRMIQSQNRTSSSDRSQVRSSRSPRDVHVSQENNLTSFVQGIRRGRKLSDLTRPQRKKYNYHLKEAKRYERMDRRKEAIGSYEKCVEIYDGDQDLTNRLLALSSWHGYICSGDFSRRPAQSPIKKQSRRRRNPGRTARGEHSNYRVEVIDLTSS